MRLLGSYIFVSFQQIIYKHGNFTNFKAFFLVVSMYSRCQVFFKFMKKKKTNTKTTTTRTWMDLFSRVLRQIELRSAHVRLVRGFLPLTQ